MLPTQHLLTKICDCVRQGRPLSVCASKHGLSQRLLKKWLTIGRNENCEDAVMERFALEIDEALADAQIDLFDTMKTHTASDWRVAEKLLKMINPELDAPAVTRIELTGDTTVTHQHELVSRDSIGDIIGLIRGNLVGGTLNIGPRPIDIVDGEFGEIGPGQTEPCEEVTDTEMV